jgi:hypothetical protein
MTALAPDLGTMLGRAATCGNAGLNGGFKSLTAHARAASALRPPRPTLPTSRRGLHAAPVVAHAAASRSDSINAMAAAAEEEAEATEEEEEGGGAAPAPLPPTPPRLPPATPVAAAISAARSAAGRPLTEADAVLGDRLEGRGVLTLGGLAGLAPADAAALRVPADLAAFLAAGLAAWDGEGAGGAAGGKERGTARKAPTPARTRGSAAVPAPSLRASGRAPGRAAVPAPSLSPTTPSFDPSTPPPAASAVAAIEARWSPLMDRYKIGFLQGPDAPRVRSAASASGGAAGRGAFSPATGVLRVAPGTSPRLDADLGRLRKFLTGRFPGQQQAPIRAVTAAKYDDHLRRWAGWWAGVVEEDATGKAPPPEVAASRAATVDLATLVPGTGPEAAALAMEYAAWLEDARKVTPHTSGLFLRSALAAAKSVHHASSTARPRDGDRAYADLGVIRELRGLSKDARAAGKRAPPAGDEAVKWLEWEDYLGLVGDLRKECAGKDNQGRKRSPAAVAWSLQRYLIFAILACVPDRQRTLRELEVGRTLVWEGPKGGGLVDAGWTAAAPAAGRWTIRHGADDYKTGGTYGPRPPLVLSPSIYPELGAFITHYRSFLAQPQTATRTAAAAGTAGSGPAGPPSHAFLFCMKNGEPLTSQALHRLFVTAAYRLTGQKTNPHLVRDMVVTHIRGRGDATERELEALALYMGHSVAMQRATYDRRTVAQKVEPAVDLLARLNGGGLGGGLGGI